MRRFQTRFAGILGNILEHYDNALFGLLAPVLAPLFFYQGNSLTALILTYGMLALGVLARPLGALWFGWMGDCLGRRRALLCSLLGMAVVTMGMGCLPTYREIGAGAPFLLALGRLLQGIFAAGETVGGALFVLEQTEGRRRGLVSGIYDASSVGGILIASALVTGLSARGGIEEGWRFLFWGGGATAFLGVFLRFRGDQWAVTSPRGKKSFFQGVREHRGALLGITLAAGFSHAAYAVAFTLMNGLVPFVTHLTQLDVMKANSAFLVVDLLLLPCFGALAYRWGKERVMLGGAVGAMLSAVPLFYFLENASFGGVLLIRLGVLVFGVAFAAPYYAWAMEQVPLDRRYTILALGTSLGSQLIGAPSAMVALWLYQKTGSSMMPGVYLMVLAACAALVVFSSVKSLRSCEEIGSKMT